MAGDSFEEIIEFIEQKGALGLLLNLDQQDGALFKEITKMVFVSGPTLSNRVTDACNLDLIKETVRAEDHGNANRYILTPKGAFVKGELKRCKVDEAYDQWVDAKQKLDERLDEFKQPEKDTDGDASSTEHSAPTHEDTWEGTPPEHTDQWSGK